MRAITVQAESVGPASSLYNALISFYPELSGSETEGYSVSVELGTSESRILEVLSAIEDHVTESNSGPASVDVGGRPYTMHAVLPDPPE